MRMVPALLVLTLSACASEGVGQGDANYDALQAATTACKAQNGELVLKSGYDGRELSSYVCKFGKKG